MADNEVPSDDIATFYRVYEDAFPLLRADQSALGTLPAAAFQFCEAMRTASSYGWYVFPPADITLLWTGTDVLYKIADRWEQLRSTHLSPEFSEYWDANAPTDLKGCAPPFLTSLFSAGDVQIWSGFLASTLTDWGLSVGPLANIVQSGGFRCYEAIVETDEFNPWPMFINIRLVATDREIIIPKNTPLFQVRPVHKSSYSDTTLRYNERVGLGPLENDTGSMSAVDWQGYRRTVRSVSFDRTLDDHNPGSYGAGLRRKRKRNKQNDV